MSLYKSMHSNNQSRMHGWGQTQPARIERLLVRQLQASQSVKLRVDTVEAAQVLLVVSGGGTVPKQGQARWCYVNSRVRPGRSRSWR